MPKINIDDLSTQIVAGVIAAIITLVIQRTWLRSPEQPSANTTINHSTTRVTHNTTVINQRIHSASTNADTDDTVGTVVLLVVAVVTTALLFILHWRLALSITSGIAIATLVITGTAALRAWRLNLWNTRGVWTAGAALVTFGLSIASWFQIVHTQRGALNLRSLGDAIPERGSAPEHKGIFGYLTYLSGDVLDAVKNFAPYALPFAVLLALSAIITAAALALTWQRANQWHAFLSFNRTDLTISGKTIARANSFLTASYKSSAIVMLAFGLIALLASNGTFFDLYVGAQNRK